MFRLSCLVNIFSLVVLRNDSSKNIVKIQIACFEWWYWFAFCCLMKANQRFYHIIANQMPQTTKRNKQHAWGQKNVLAPMLLQWSQANSDWYSSWHASRNKQKENESLRPKQKTGDLDRQNNSTQEKQNLPRIIATKDMSFWGRDRVYWRQAWGNTKKAEKNKKPGLGRNVATRDFFIFFHIVFSFMIWGGKGRT